MIVKKKERKVEIDVTEVKLLDYDYYSKVCSKVLLLKTYYVVDIENDVELALNFKSSLCDQFLAVLARGHSSASGYSLESFLEKRILEYISSTYFNVYSLYQVVSVRHDNLEIQILNYGPGGFRHGVYLGHVFHNKKINFKLNELYRKEFGENEGDYYNEFVEYKSVTHDNLDLAVTLNNKLPYGDSLNKIFNTLLLKPELSDDVFWNTQKIIRSSVVGSKSDVGYIKFNVVDS